MTHYDPFSGMVEAKDYDAAWAYAQAQRFEWPADPLCDHDPPCSPMPLPLYRLFVQSDGHSEQYYSFSRPQGHTVYGGVLVPTKTGYRTIDRMDFAEGSTVHRATMLIRGVEELPEDLRTERLYVWQPNPEAPVQVLVSHLWPIPAVLGALSEHQAYLRNFLIQDERKLAHAG